MTEELRDRPPPLKLVAGYGRGQAARNSAHGPGKIEPVARDVDWTILMARAQDGDRTAYLRLLAELVPYLRSLVGRQHCDPQDVEDVVQDILLTLHAIRHTFDPARPFGPWLVAIANRRLVDRLRRQGRARARETPLTVEHETFAAPPPNFEGNSDQRELESAISKLPPAQRQAIRLLKLKEMSLKEAATASGISIASLKVATHRALKSLRKILADQSET
jgi:RNA polymerase sigma-70 factor (ECF subfamily)